MIGQLCFGFSYTFTADPHGHSQKPNRIRLIHIERKHAVWTHGCELESICPDSLGYQITFGL